MKKIICAMTSLMLCCALTLAVIPSYVTAAFYGSAELLEIKSHIEKDAGMSLYATVQGACTDGRYAYFAVQEYTTVILKYDMRNWKLVKKATVSDLGHANDMAYNTLEDVIVVANNNAREDVLTLLDPDSLTVIDTVEPMRKKTAKEKEQEKKEQEQAQKNGNNSSKENKTEETEEEKEKKDYKPLRVYSIAYQEAENRYVVGLSGSYNFAILDEKFKMVKQFKGVKTGYTRQGCDCDDDYIYFTQSDGDNIVVIYDYEGNYVDTVSLEHSHEVENLFHVDDDFYLTLHYYGNSVQRVGLSDATQIRFKVNYAPNGGSSKMEPTYVHYGEDTKLRKCAFKKPGYLFGGWRVTRNYNGTSLGVRNGAAQHEWLDPKDIYDYTLIKDEQKVAKLTRIGDVTATAFWISETYDVAFDSGSGEGWMDTDTVAYADAYEIPQCAFYRHGYVFVGYTAQRDADGRVYGYREGADRPRWLEPEDMAQAYVFSPGEQMTRMTYDGTVTFTAHFTIAFTYDEDQSTLLSYVGVDERVDIPNPSGRLRTIADGAFSDNAIMTELTIPGSVEVMERGAVTNCPSLHDVLFEEGLPASFDEECIVGSGTQEIYLIIGAQPMAIGAFTGGPTAGFIRDAAAAVQYSAAAYFAEQKRGAVITLTSESEYAWTEVDGDDAW